MRKNIRFVYIFGVALVCVMLALFHFHEKVDETITRGNAGFQILKDY